MSTHLQSITIQHDSRLSSAVALAGILYEFLWLHAQGIGQLTDGLRVRSGLTKLVGADSFAMPHPDPLRACLVRFMLLSLDA